jgi:hypothetical protein
MFGSGFPCPSHSISLCYSRPNNQHMRPARRMCPLLCKHLPLRYPPTWTAAACQRATSSSSPAPQTRRLISTLLVMGRRPAPSISASAMLRIARLNVALTHPLRSLSQMRSLSRFNLLILMVRGRESAILRSRIARLSLETRRRRRLCIPIMGFIWMVVSSLSWRSRRECITKLWMPLPLESKCAIYSRRHFRKYILSLLSSPGCTDHFFDFLPLLSVPSLN